MIESDHFGEANRVTTGIAAAARGATSAVARATGEWRRETMLPRLLPIGPEEIADLSPEGRLAVLRRIVRALRGERVRGRAGHWSYSLDRHLGLLQALAAERRALPAEARPGIPTSRRHDTA